MRPEMYTGSGSGLGERTPLVADKDMSHRCESGSLAFSRCVGETWPVYDAEERFLRSVFCVGGLTICVVEATVITRPRLSRCFPRFWPSTKYCNAAVALLREGGLHVIADVDGVAGKHLLRIMTGSNSCTSGSVLANGVPVEAGVFRKAVGVIGDVKTPMPNLTVEQNINFVVSMRTKKTGDSRETLVEAACVLTELDRRKTAKRLTLSEGFRLRLAMEIVRNPPVIVAYCPLDSLGLADAAECTAVLKRVSTILKKTVIISTKNLATNLFTAADTVLLFGRGGHVLYSGEAAEMPSYFNSLPISPHLSPYDNNTYEGRRVGHDTSSAAYDYSRESVPSVIESDMSDNKEKNLSAPSCATRETRSIGAADLVLCGGDALDMATWWAESEATTQFYSLKFHESRMCRQLLREITRFSTPPQYVGDVTPFTAIASPQYAIWKPVLLWWYDTLQIWRGGEVYIHLALLSLGLLGISLLMHHQEEDQGGMYNIRGIQFVLFLLTMIANVTATSDMDRQLHLFFHQRNSGLYNTLCFMVVFVLQTIIIRAVYLVMFVPVVLFIVKMKAPFLLLVGALSVTDAFLHVTVHTLVPYKRGATLALRLYLGYCILFSGFLLNLNSMPGTVGKLSVLRWGYGAALAQSLRNKPFSCDGAGNTSYCYSGNTYLKLEGFSNESTGLSLTVFGAVSGTLVLIMGIALACRG
ncbi:ABC transporter [Trypanosoma grayi]|uniref:ABC transporter n=1 Tax=Trypanosoma grayi TaxID=71804 RepID=UPI0004F47CD4|nr:ABC transporter [Trypanosoma grayi]KEG14418.1 ABC transporter [Trypanosoma grayi]